MKKSATVLLIALIAGLLAGCSPTATPKSDTYLCVFAGGGSQRLKYQLPPGSSKKNIGQKDTVVELPASNRFYMAAKDDSIRDPLAPHFYSANASHGVPIELEGQVRFRFNLPKACDWYSKHGRRNANNGDLQFNARGAQADNSGDLQFNARGAQADNSGWLRWLAENFGLTMDTVAKQVTNTFDWAHMYYDYPVNADNIGDLPKGQAPGEATSQQLGVALGAEFTKELNANLGGDYFCGIDTAPGSNSCPPMTFQVKAVTPAGASGAKLIADRSNVEATRQDLQTTQLQGQLQQEQAAAVVRAETAKQQILAAQAKTANVQAQIDTAKCRAYAAVGLDCDGHFPNQIINGTSTRTGP